MSLVIPGILNELDLSDIICSIAPKNTLLLAGTEDMYSKDAPEIARVVHHQLAELGVPDNLELNVFDGGHALTSERFALMVDWVLHQSGKLNEGGK